MSGFRLGSAALVLAGLLAGCGGGGGSLFESRSQESTLETVAMSVGSSYTVSSGDSIRSTDGGTCTVSVVHSVDSTTKQVTLTSGDACVLLRGNFSTN